MFEDLQVRVTALQLAVGRYDDTPQNVVEAAYVFYAFLTGDADEVVSAEVPEDHLPVEL
jgi:hypothetical protein